MRKPKVTSQPKLAPLKNDRGSVQSFRRTPGTSKGDSLATSAERKSRERPHIILPKDREVEQVGSRANFSPAKNLDRRSNSMVSFAMERYKTQQQQKQMVMGETIGGDQISMNM